MIDKQFELAVELFTNEGYFGRYRELIAGMTCRAAWEQVESELPFGLRRFVSYAAFKEALRLERRRQLPVTVRLQYNTV